MSFRNVNLLMSICHSPIQWLQANVTFKILEVNNVISIVIILSWDEQNGDQN